MLYLLGGRCIAGLVPGSFSDAYASDFLLDEEGFQYRPTQDEMKKLALEGQSLLFIDCLKGK